MGQTGIAVDRFHLKEDGSFAWSDSKDRRIGTGRCNKQLCTFLGSVVVNDEEYTKTMAFFYSSDAITVSETTSGPNYKHVTQVSYQKIGN